MTKKRFVKLVMSYEVQRNEAYKMAENVAQYGSYETLFESIVAGLCYDAAITRAKRALKNFKICIINAAKTMAETIAPGIQAAANVIQEYLKEKEQTVRIDTTTGEII